MKYGDERDRLTAPRLSRRQFLASGGQHAARIAAGALLPGADEPAAERTVDAPLDPSDDPPDDAQR